ncbi:uncharacterized protein EDB91DRAFT_206340 [Suillus paluster]|uniref:uncharacterized protein n=1 Tax=Suillus paluster TaxID=48578 RepID=UPI001B87F701|nr:uncharacterized protein EDB91DRAFT_206340 [Suillus paluster]KAG1743962.1 hypothetical protein EDB91DRAFT_206340 [Suillus paluster]
MTFLYLSVRYLGIVYAGLQIIPSITTMSLTDVVSFVVEATMNWTTVVVTAMLGVIMITRLYAMYQRSRTVLVLSHLIVGFLVANIANGVITGIIMRRVSGEELILSGTHVCSVGPDGDGDISLLNFMAAMLITVWEVLALCLAVWIAVKRFCELCRQSTGQIIEDCFMVLMKSHVVYFASFVAVSCFQLAYLSPAISVNMYALETQIYLGVLQIFLVVQMFVLGPRLVLGVREYNAKLVADSHVATAMTSIAFQERVHVSTSSSV